MKRIKRNNRGFTMAELLIVVAIIAVLSGVGFIAVQNYSRGMAQLERDSIAKEIFVAAQNHLTQANSQGYPGVTDFGTAEDVTNNNNIYYYAVNDEFPWDSASAIDQMLPFGSIDETVRAGGTYIIRYQSNPATVLDVFYCPPAGQYPHKLVAREYDALKNNYRGDEKRNARRNYGDDGAVIGWYGGAESLEIGAEINAPDIRVENGDRLTVKVYNTNKDLSDTSLTPDLVNEKVSLKLIITGVTSGAQKAIALHKSHGANMRYNDAETMYGSNGKYDTSGGDGAMAVDAYTVVLDDVTTTVTENPVDLRFSALYDSEGDKTTAKFIPGENIIIRAVAYSNSELTNIAYSREYTTNSLFADKVPVEGSTESTDPNVGTPSVATVASIRHLENLDKAVSGFAEDDAQRNKLNIQKVEQTQDLDWSAFKTAIALEKAESVRILYNDGTTTEAGCYKPVDIGYALTYDGMTTLTETPAEGDLEEEAPPKPVTTQVIHEIKNIRVNTDADAGVFGRVSAICTIKNLKIVDCDIASTGVGSSAGALAGSLSGVAVKNVVACGGSTFTVTKEDGTTETVTRNITSTKGSAGGLIGSMNGGSVENCAAALYVNGGKDAGGLIGSATNGAQVKASYSGGHTENGAYNPDKINVTGAENAGGLIGSAGNAKIENSYSTCSVKGQTAGGLAGTAGGEIRNCYCTGLVVGKDEDAVVGAFAGVLTSGIDKVADCKYFEIINGELSVLGTGSTEGLVVDALDADTKSYNDFVGCPDSWNDAKPYDDEKLTQYYGDSEGKPRFNLRTVDQIGQTTKENTGAVHYGDWPAPEIFVTNEAE